jgi:bilin biosynthesis protein
LQEESKPSIDKEDTALSTEEAADLAAELKTQLKGGKKPEGDINLIKKLITGLGDKRGLLRRTFAESLGLIGTDALPELRKALLNSKSVTVRRAAAKTLKLVGDPSALPDLLYALLTDKDPVVQGSAVAAMAIFGEDAAKSLLLVLENPNSSEMQCGLASWGLSFIGAKGAEILKRAAMSNNEKVRASSIAALGEQIQLFCDTEAKDILTNAINDLSDDVQIEAIKLMGLLDDQNWDLNLIGEKLNSNNPQVRKQSALSLMKLQAISQIKNLRQSLLKEKDLEVINVINLSLSKIDT